jgi:hypothetical protein
MDSLAKARPALRCRMKSSRHCMKSSRRSFHSR